MNKVRETLENAWLMLKLDFFLRRPLFEMSFKKLKSTVLFSEKFPGFTCGWNQWKFDVSGKSAPFEELAFLKISAEYM